MAEISLNNRECRKDGLPDACAMCGKRNTQPRKMTVGDHVNHDDGTATLKFREVWLPLCTAHRAKMGRSLVIALTALVLMILAFIGSIVLMATVNLIAGIAAGVGSVVVGVTVMMLAGKGQVRARRINKGGVSLINVSMSFVKAVKQHRAAAESEGQDEDEEEDEPAPPRKKKRPLRD